MGRRGSELTGQPLPNRVPLQPQDLAITILSAHLRRPGERVWSGGMVRILGEFGFSTEAARAALSRLVTRRLLTRHREGRLVHYALSPKAQEIMADGDRRIFSLGRGAPSTDTWTVLWHSIPEDRRVERAQLARRLRFLGFGSVQDATWIAASDREQEVRVALTSLGVEQFASVFLGRIASRTEQALLESDAWDLEDVERRYTEFLEEFGSYADPDQRDRLSDRDAFVVRCRMLHAFRSFPFVDPELPDHLAPAPSRRAASVETFDLVFDALAEQARAFFTEVAQTELPAEGAVSRR
jgi:phenylacetic acid degradation operon negative regulatory protein